MAKICSNALPQIPFRSFKKMTSSQEFKFRILIPKSFIIQVSSVQTSPKYSKMLSVIPANSHGLGRSPMPWSYSYSCLHRPIYHALLENMGCCHYFWGINTWNKCMFTQYKKLYRIDSKPKEHWKNAHLCLVWQSLLHVHLLIMLF